MICLQPVIHLLSQNAQVLYDPREIGGRDAASQVATRGVSLLRVRFDLAHLSLARGGGLRRQGMFEAFDHPLVMPLAQRDAKAAGPQSNIGERKNAVVGRLKAKVVRDALHLHVRLRAVHDAKEVNNLPRTAGLSLVPTELYQLF